MGHHRARSPQAHWCVLLTKDPKSQLGEARAGAPSPARRARVTKTQGPAEPAAPRAKQRGGGVQKGRAAAEGPPTKDSEAHTERWKTTNPTHLSTPRRQALLGASLTGAADCDSHPPPQSKHRPGPGTPPPHDLLRHPSHRDSWHQTYSHTASETTPGQAHRPRVPKEESGFPPVSQRASESWTPQEGWCLRDPGRAVGWAPEQWGEACAQGSGRASPPQSAPSAERGHTPRLGLALKHRAKGRRRQRAARGAGA